tara:strand:- start:16834 stop:17229 length:396 start_codon:yes stop_codon:yes gene_type:complete
MMKSVILAAAAMSVALTGGALAQESASLDGQIYAGTTTGGLSYTFVFMGMDNGETGPASGQVSVSGSSEADSGEMDWTLDGTELTVTLYPVLPGYGMSLPCPDWQAPAVGETVRSICWLPEDMFALVLRVN